MRALPLTAAATVLCCAAVLSAVSQVVGPKAREPEITETALGAAVLAAEDARAPTNTQVAVILEGTKASLLSLKRASIRAVGRLEQRAAGPNLLPFLNEDDYTTGLRPLAAFAIAQAMRGEPLQIDTGATQVEGMLVVLSSAAASERQATGVASIARSIARLPYTRGDQVERAEQMLAEILRVSKMLLVQIKDERDRAAVMVGGARGLEMLARLRRNLYAPNDRTTALLRTYAIGSGGLSGSVAEAIRGPAFSALMSSGGVDADTLRPNVTYDRNPEVRRAAMSILAGSGSPIVDDERADFIRRGLTDREWRVRYEAVRGFARVLAKTDGCLPLTQMLNDPSEHVALAIIDALGDACAADTDSLDTVVGLAGTPPDAGSWRRESHALVALAKRSPEHLAIPLLSHARHNAWQVRMYAARAAAVVKDAAVLEQLLLDDHDNVRHEALVPLYRLNSEGAERYFLAALSRDDYQLLRTAARELAGVTPTRALADALVDALLRVTAQRRETSRDTRTAILERLRDFGSSRYLERLRPLLRDFDSRIAEATAATLNAWTGQTFETDPQPLPRPPLPSPAELTAARTMMAFLVMESGRDIHLTLDVDTAPLAAVRFMRLANANYYDGLTFHRVVPNFVLQGGSPGANEYMGDGPFMRDEISDRTHATGTVGISTRGRDTGDAQFFINMIPNPRLDFEYTVFASIVSMDAVDQIGEGDRIRDIVFRRGRQ
jgi:cyclophilin family peptidyl-prolyl cis-trans isomerase/HEAT repeat protein